LAIAFSTMPSADPLGGQVEQHGVDASVGEVGSDLGTHDAGTQHGGAAD
jgi:hypothetical protein